MVHGFYEAMNLCKESHFLWRQRSMCIILLTKRCHRVEDCTLPHLLRQKLPESSGFHWNPPNSNPGMSWCDKGQIGIFIPGGVRWSPPETSIFQQSPWNLSGLFPLSKSTGLQRNNQTLVESNRITRLQRNPME